MPGVKTELLNPGGSQSFWGDGIWVHWWEGNDHTEKGLFYIILLTSLLSRVFIPISRWGKQSLSLLICSGHKPRHSWDWNPGLPDSMLKLFISILLGLPPAGPLLTPSPMAETSSPRRGVGDPTSPFDNSLKYLPWWPQVKKNMPLLWTSTAFCNRSWYLQLSPGGNKFVHCSCLGSVHLTCLMYLTPSSTPWTSTNLCSQYLCNK